MEKKITINNRIIKWGSRTYIMGILNITADSFSGDGLLLQGDDKSSQLDAVMEQASHFMAAGADILDVGGESTRPGSEPIGVDEELERVVPVIQMLSNELDVIISVDTYKAKVAESAIKAGAHIVNDVWGLRADPELARIVAKYNVPVILMHNRSNPASAQVRDRLGGRYIGVKYDDLLEDVKRELLECVELARKAGIPDNRVILDPGIGFGKTVAQNLELLNRLDEIRSLGYPVLLGPSRKSFIGYTLDVPPDQRFEGTSASVTVGIVRGADIIRVHDIEKIVRVAQMTDAIARKNK